MTVKELHDRAIELLDSEGASIGLIMTVNDLATRCKQLQADLHSAAINGSVEAQGALKNYKWD